MKPKIKIKVLTSSLMMIVVTMFMFFFALALHLPVFFSGVFSGVMGIVSFFLTWGYVNKTIKQHVETRKRGFLEQQREDYLATQKKNGEVRHIQIMRCDTCGELGYLDFHYQGWNYCSEKCLKEGIEQIKELRCES